jgi:methylenetetrahydrofolate reductase (NADPH)
MRIDEMFETKDEPVFSFEFFPPKTPEGEENLLEALAQLGPMRPDYVSVTYGAGGSTRDKTLEVVSRLKADFDLEAMAHFTCVNATVEDLRATLTRMRDAGVENVLALRGDPPAGQERWTKTQGGLEFSRELIELIDEEFPEFAIGAAAFPEVHVHAVDAETDLRHLKAKVDAGARFLITQLFFDNAAFDDFVVRAREAGIDVPIVPGIMPVTNARQIQRMAELSGSAIPDPVREQLEARADDPAAVLEFGVAYATLQCADLLAKGAPGIHFYTLNRSPATRAILSALRLLRPWQRAGALV